MASHSRHFTVSAQCGDSARSSTRCAAASAMVLADQWADQGCNEIRLIDPDGRASTREIFRASLLRARNLGRRAVPPLLHPIGRTPA